MNLPNPLPADRDILADLANQVINELMPSCDNDFIKANRLSRAQYPQLFDAWQKSLMPKLEPVLPVRATGQLAGGGADPNDNPSNPFNPAHLGAIANDMDNKAVRKTYTEALAKHMDENPDDGPIKSHRLVMKKHPTLAVALRGDKPSPSDDDADSDAETSAALGNSRAITVLANERNLPDVSAPFLMLSNAAGWALA
jgi:hypothetical protein